MSRRTFNPDVYEGHEGLRRFKRERDEVWDEETPNDRAIVQMRVIASS